MNEHVQRYIDAVVDERRALYDRLHALIMDLYPDARAVISYQVPMYKTKSGWIALGYWKKGVSLYTGVQPMAEFKAEHPHIKTGKGSINFKVTDVVPQPAVQKVITQCMERRRSEETMAEDNQ